MHSFMPLMLLFLTALALSASEPEPLVPKCRDKVQPEVERRLIEAQKNTFKELAVADTVKARFKPPLRQQGVKDPWAALTELERRGLVAAKSAQGGLNSLPDTVAAMNLFLDRPPARPLPMAHGKLLTLEDHVQFITAVLDAAEKQREEALAKLNESDRAFMHERPKKLIHEFGPQESLDEKTRAQLQDDLKFCTTWEEKIDGQKFTASVQTFLQLTSPDYLDELRSVMAKASPLRDRGVKGSAGELLFVRETRHGLIVLAGGKKNTFELTEPVAFLADLAGDDTYKGQVAASFDAKHSFSLVVDFSGNDAYESVELGLATGRLGSGCLIDRDGDDSYKLTPGCGGCGFGGVGLLVDEAGKDTYTGSRFCQGAAVAGLGVLLDLAGDDTYTAFGYAVGIGGPVGIDGVIDVAGNDSYQCGHKYGSGYNASDAPSAKPGDPNFQYDAFGLGIGLGRRTYPASEEGNEYHLAGGVGVWLDLAGNDRSESSNFSQACSYFFGIGLKMDLAGDDCHSAARYGHAAGAHYGLGLFLDYSGDDVYLAEGPTYNIGCAWDRSVFLLADGRGNDLYDLTKSSGGGRGDYGGWGCFIDWEGKDIYRTNSILGGTTEKGLGLFLDGDGIDEYPKLTGASTPANAATRHDGSGGLFIDRKGR